MSQMDYDLKNVLVPNRLVGLWRMMSGYHWAYLGAAICVGLAAVGQTAFYYLIRYLIDDILGNPQAMSRVPAVAVGFVGLALVQGFFTYLSGRLAAQTAEGVTVRLRNYLFDHLQRLTFTYHDKTQTGELIQRATSDVDALRRFYNDQAIGIGRIVLLFAVNVGALMTLNVRLALASVATIPLIVLTSIFFFKKVTKAYELFQEQEAKLSTTLQENLTGVRVVKAFARQSYERNKFEVDNREKYRRGRRLLFMHAFFWPSSDILCGFQMLFGFYLGAQMAIEGIITPGTYLAFAGILIWVIWPIRNLGRLVVQMSTGLVSFGRVVEVIKQEREPLLEGGHHPAGDSQGEIIFDNVSFAYEGGEAVLHDISFAARPGQIIALLGSTGSGKSSLVSLLPRFYDYTNGKITLDGTELKQYPRVYLRQQIGIVEQEPFLFSRSIRDNITYGVGRQVTDEEVIWAAQAAAVHEAILKFPEKYNTLVGEKGVTLSGGQKQRIAVARTLLKNPRILILDDATSSVDTETEAAIRGAMKRLMSGRTTFVIAHRIQSVMNADLILVLDKGRVVQQGTHSELMSRPGAYRRIYDLQALIEDELTQEISGVGGKLPVATLEVASDNLPLGHYS